VATVFSETLEAQLAEAFAEFGPAYRRLVHSAKESTGITYARARLLHALQVHGPTIMSGLRHELGITARSVTALVDGLEEEGHVRRVPHPTDRRATVIELTGAGMQAVQGLHAAFSGAAATAFHGLPPGDKAHLLRIMRTVVEQLRAETEGLPDPRC
jgi:DNA-binding MarR family transcriptional regulator